MLLEELALSDVELLAKACASMEGIGPWRKVEKAAQAAQAAQGAYGDETYDGQWFQNPNPWK